MQHHADEAEILRGGLLLSYGLHKQAGEVFEALLARGAAPSVRDRAWYFLAKIRYQRGLMPEASQALGRIEHALPAPLEDDRQLLQANVMMALGDNAGAGKILAPIAGPRGEDLYARYNLGVALIRSGDAAHGTHDPGRPRPPDHARRGKPRAARQGQRRPRLRRAEGRQAAGRAHLPAARAPARHRGQRRAAGLRLGRRRARQPQAGAGALGRARRPRPERLRRARGAAGRALRVRRAARRRAGAQALRERDRQLRERGRQHRRDHRGDPRGQADRGPDARAIPARRWAGSRPSATCR